MKKTNMKLCVGKQNGYDVYRVVFEKDGHYFVKWGGEIFNVDVDIAERRYVLA